MRVWRMSLRRTESTTISRHGLNQLQSVIRSCYSDCTVVLHIIVIDRWCIFVVFFLFLLVLQATECLLTLQIQNRFSRNLSQGFNMTKRQNCVLLYYQVKRRYDYYRAHWVSYMHKPISSAWSKEWKYEIWASSRDYGTYHIGDQRRHRRACASAQSRQSLRCSHTWSIEVNEGSDQTSDI